MDIANLLLHPVRLRIVHALSSRGELTTAQLGTYLPEVPRVTLYRQVALLVEGRFLEVSGEQRVRGAVERRYRLRQDRPVIEAHQATAMTPEDHRRGFAAAMAVVIAEFNAYLGSDGAAPVADGVSYRQAILWLNPDELAEMTGQMLEVLRDSITHQPAPGRAPYLLSPILFPAGRSLPPPD